MVRPRPGEVPRTYEMRYLSPSTPDDPELYIVYARQEIEKMGRDHRRHVHPLPSGTGIPEQELGDEVEDLKKLEDYTDQMQEQLSRFLASIAMDNINAQTAININSMVRTVHELESMGDSCYNLILLTQRKYDKKILFPDIAMEELKPFTETVVEFIGFIRKHINKHLSKNEMETALGLEDRTDQYRNILKKAARKRIQKGSDVKTELLYIDIVKAHRTHRRSRAEHRGRPSPGTLKVNQSFRLNPLVPGTVPASQGIQPLQGVPHGVPLDGDYLAVSEFRPAHEYQCLYVSGSPGHGEIEFHNL